MNIKQAWNKIREAACYSARVLESERRQRAADALWEAVEIMDRVVESDPPTTGEAIEDVRSEMRAVKLAFAELELRVIKLREINEMRNAS